MQKVPAFALFSLFPALVLCFCHANRKPSAEPRIGVVTDSLPYDLSNPTLTINLVSEALKEISGLSPSNKAGEYVAIADERGEVFFVDGNGGGAVTRQVLFAEKGDFEGVEMVDESIWASKSKGDLYEIRNWEKSMPSVTEYKTPLKKHNDVEGLAYDPWRKALLLACKENPDSLYERCIYAFDIKEKKLSEAPVYKIDPSIVNQWVSYGPNEKHDFFSPSGLALHPRTKDVYVISTALKRLVVLDYQTGAVKFARRLDKKILPQPEGIAFDAEGNLYLSSEGKQGEGLLLRFDIKTGK